MPKVTCSVGDSTVHQSTAWDRHSKVQRSAKVGPKPNHTSGEKWLAKSVSQSHSLGRAKCSSTSVGPGPTMVYIQHPAPKVRRYGNMKTSIKTTVGILQQSVEVINTDIRCDGMHQSHHGLQSPRILLMRQCQSSSHCHEKVNVAPVPYIIVKVHSTCASPSACSKL